MPAIGILIIVAFIVLIIFGSIASQRAKAARLAALNQIANQNGWQFNPDENYYHDEQFPQFSIFNTGSSRYAYNTLTGNLQMGPENWPLRAGDYHYTTTSGSGKDQTTHHHHFSYLLIKLPYRQLPSLALRPEGLFDRLASFIGFDDIDFESAEFSKRFHVKGSDKKFVYDIIHPRMMEFLMATDPLPINLEDGWCYISNGSTVWEPEEFFRHTNFAVEFFMHWPQHVVSTLER